LVRPLLIAVVPQNIILMNVRRLSTLAAALSLSCATLHAVPVAFTKLTNNSTSNVAGQLSVAVTAVGSTQVAFQFTNNVGIASSITDIYFQSSNLSSTFAITDSGAGVDFTAPATPGDLPGGNLASPPFVATVGLSADSTSPITANGVNAAGEFVTLTFGLGTFANFAAVITAINNGTLRIGLHVQAQGTDGNSDGYLNTPGTGQPPPGVPDGGSAVALLGVAFAALALARRKLA
jgi:hypothetical protein